VTGAAQIRNPQRENVALIAAAISPARISNIEFALSPKKFRIMRFFA
jgi:hypothetical protein